MISWAIWVKNVNRIAIKQKRPPKSSKNQMFVFGLHSTSDDRPNDLSKKRQPKCKKTKGPLSHWKIKCSFLDYIQLLMISWVIRAKNIDRNAKKWKRPPKSLKNKMSVFGLHSTSDDRPSNLSKKMLTEMQNNKKGPLSHQKIKCSFLDYIQLLMIGQAIRVKNVNRNAKKQKRPP